MKGTYEGCTAYIRDPSDLRDDASFRNESLREIKHVLDFTRLTRRILDAKYQKANLSQIVSNSKH